MPNARGAVIHAIGQPWRVEELTVADPGPREVLVRVTASGLCHSDDHIVQGDLRVTLPQVGGHEGAGVVEAVGSAVSMVKAGDRVSTLFIPACGTCLYCSTGRSYICNGAMGMEHGLALDGTPRFFLSNGQGVGATCRVGSFANYLVCHETQAVAVPDWADDVEAALVSCAVPTGWGAVVNRAKVRPGEVVVVMGVGGVGINAVQAARYAGARAVIAVDPIAFKREAALAHGATAMFESIDEARDQIAHLTNGQGADAVIVSVGRVDGTILGEGFSVTGKDGICVLVALGSEEPHVAANPRDLSNLTKTITGTLYGNCNPRADIPRLLGLAREGRLDIAGLVTRTYEVDQINEAYADMHAGKNIRGVIIHSH